MFFDESIFYESIFFVKNAAAFLGMESSFPVLPSPGEDGKSPAQLLIQTPYNHLSGIIYGIHVPD